MLTAKDIIEQNNKKRKYLTPENELYYENMLVFIRSNAFKKERETEEVLLEMLDHLIEAQKDGKTAEEVFGKTPEQLAEQIIDSLPKESIKDILEFGFEIVFTLFGWFLAIWGLMPFVTKKEQTIYLGSTAISALLLIGSLILLVYVVFSVLKKNAFSNSKKKKTLAWGLGILMGLVWAAVFLMNILLEPIGPTVEINYYTSFGLGCFFLLAAFILKKSREAK
jgi:uncharacterized membrane-anchored protein